MRTGTEPTPSSPDTTEIVYLYRGMQVMFGLEYKLKIIISDTPREM